MFDDSDAIPFKITKSVRLKLGDSNSDFKSGCAVIEAVFPANKGCKVGFIKFKNSYVASISIRVKIKREDKDEETIWKTVLKDFKLMPSPHHESGSQDCFIIDAENQFQFQPESVMAVRLILRQPSPHWINFDLEDLAFYLPCSKLCEADKSVLKNETECLVDDTQDNAKDHNAMLLEHGVSFEDIASKFSKMASLAHDDHVTSSLKHSSADRFDVDGSYDLNLLSYT